MTTDQNSEALRLKDLANFTGTENWYRHGLIRSVTYTDGAKHVADAGGAYWLLDEIAFAQHCKKVAAEQFQLWSLSVKPDNTARLVCTDGNGKRVFSKRIDYTDFPLPQITFYVVNNVIHLPSEY